VCFLVLPRHWRHPGEGREMEVLVVDDELLVREIVSDNLTDDGFQVADAGSAEDALRLAESVGLPRVVIIDVNLGPGMDGLSLVKEFHRRSPLVGVIIMTGDPSVVFHWKWQDNERYLPKPFDRAELTRVVQELMSR
jgi:DNA-binding response OmpR family regulator